jgi:LMBR1 domain-containing protein 1
MVDWLTLIMTIVISITLIIANIYLLIYYSHPDDKGTLTGYFTKGIAILGLTLAWAQVLLLPLDVSNNRGDGNGINMKIFWIIIYVLSFIYIIIIFPIVTAFYDSDFELTFNEKLKHSICSFLATFISFILISIILHYTIGKANIKLNYINCPISNYEYSNIEITANNEYCIENKGNISIKVNYVITCLAIFSFISWFLFAIFGGIGLSALPLDFFNDFCTRPKSIRSEDIRKRREDLIYDIEKLKLLGEEIKKMEEKGIDKKFFLNSKKRQYNRKKREFVAGKLLVEQEFSIVNVANEIRIKNNCYVLLYYLLIPLGIISLILTILWIIQFICSYFYIKNGNPGYPFLSNLLIFFQDHDCAFISFFLFAVLNFYLLLCLIKGNIKFGVRFFCCWSIHPMKKEGTYMNSFLFNITLILLGSISITQFCSYSLPDYIAFTDIAIIFNVQIKYMKFFSFFYKNHIFEYALFAIFVISLIYLLFRPTDRVNPKINNEDRPYKYKEEKNKLNIKPDKNNDLISKDKTINSSTDGK